MLLAFVGGVLVSIQAAMNTHLRSFMTSPLTAAFLSFLVGTLLLGVLLVVRSGADGTFRQAIAAASQAPWWVWFGGACGAGYVLSVIVGVPYIGVAWCMAFVVLGQQLGALTIDHFGWMAVPRAPLDLSKLAGAGLIVAGVWLLQGR